MKAIVIFFDTLNRHFLPSYGNESVSMPSLSRLAERSVVFDNHWIGSAPCMPARRDMMTGRLNFLERGWGGMEPYDICLPHVLARAGIHSHMETDHYHYIQGGGEFYYSTFSTWQAHRGQEFDPIPCRIRPSDALDPDLVWNRDVAQRNLLTFAKDEDFSTPRTLQGATDWLQLNKGSDDYLLWVEAFDPHGPMDYPPEYDDLYDQGFDEDFPIEALPTDTEPEFVTRMARQRRRYASLLAMVDRWLGVFLDEVDRQNLWEDTLIIATTDHGLMFGEHGLFGKNHCHSWNQLAHIPLFIHLPGDLNAGQRRAQLTQTPDLFPTLLQHYGVGFDHAIHGRSFLDVATENADAHRDLALFGWYGKTVSVTDGRRTYFRGPASRDNQPLYHYFLMPTQYHGRIAPSRLKDAEFGRFLPHLDVPVLRVPGIPEFGINEEIYSHRLFDLRADPSQQQDLCGTPVESEMIDLLREGIRIHDGPVEQLTRLGLD